MKAVVVYESLWGNTAAIAQAVAEGLGDGAGAATPKPPKPADLSHPSMRSWLAALPAGKGRSAAFETRIWWSPGSAAKTILTGLEAAGFAPLEREKFLVTGRYGPLKDGEIERARAWGARLARAR